MKNSRSSKEDVIRWADANIETQKQGLRVMDQIEHLTSSILGSRQHSVEAYSASGDAVYVNDGWKNLWGMEPRIMEEYNMLKDENLRTKITWPAIEKGFNGTAGSTPEAYFTPEEIGFPGRPRWTDGYIAPVLNSDDQVARVVLMLRDITDTKLALQQIATLRNDLQTLQFQYEAIAERLDMLANRDDKSPTRLYGMPSREELLRRATMLSTRERQVFALLAADKAVKEIAFDLNLGNKSVYTYRARMLEKLGLTSDMQVAAAYREVEEFITPGQITGFEEEETL